MTVFNTQYCSIDEAWGDLTGKSKKDINKKKKTQDPICELYDAKSKSNSSYTENDLVNFANEYYEKFDKNKYQRNMQTQSSSYEEVKREPSPKSLVIKQEQSKYEAAPSNNSANSALFEKQFEMNLPPLYSGECSTVNSNDNNSVFQENRNMKGYIENENNYNDKEKEIERERERRPIYSEEERRPIYSEEERKSNYSRDDKRLIYSEKDKYLDDYADSHNYQSYRKKNSNLQILDLILYIVSGIILIFLLEQFVKIGINMQR